MLQIGKKYKMLEFPGISTKYVDEVRVIDVTKFGNGETVVTYRKYYLPFLWIDMNMEYKEFIKAIESSQEVTEGSK